jgi:hypothetical protein
MRFFSRRTMSVVSRITTRQRVYVCLALLVGALTQCSGVAMAATQITSTPEHVRYGWCYDAIGYAKDPTSLAWIYSRETEALTTYWCSNGLRITYYTETPYGKSSYPEYFRGFDGPPTEQWVNQTNGGDYFVVRDSGYFCKNPGSVGVTVEGTGGNLGLNDCVQGDHDSIAMAPFGTLYRPQSGPIPVAYWWGMNSTTSGNAYHTAHYEGYFG